MSCKQIIFIIFNSIFFILGIAVLGVGIYSKVEMGNWKSLIDTSAPFQAANILIAAGVFVALIGFLGCFGAWKKNAFCLIAYAVLVLLIFILEIAAGIFAYTQKDKVQKELEKGVKKAVLTSYGKTNTADKAITAAVDWFQKNVKCCGSANASDWMTSSWFTATGKLLNTTVPTSCCVKVKSGCNRKPITTLANAKEIYTMGCIEQGKNFVKKNLYLVGGVGVGIGVVELLGIVCAILLCREFKEQGQTA